MENRWNVFEDFLQGLCLLNLLDSFVIFQVECYTFQVLH